MMPGEGRKTPGGFRECERLCIAVWNFEGRYIKNLKTLGCK